ncbi:hypothetical protein FACS1894166_02150 [Bacilli bacterium]|nr:hypothetical protein FACS1894166_02150 [Bacilli bacterium]
MFNSQVSPVLMFPTISYISIVFIGLLVLPAIIFTYRKSNILRRIEDSGNTKMSFMFAMCLFFTLLFVLTYSVNCGLCTLILIKNRQMVIM